MCDHRGYKLDELTNKMRCKECGKPYNKKRLNKGGKK